MNPLSFITRTGPLVRKELLSFLRDPRSRMVLIVPPILQLVIFAFATTLEVKQNTLTLFNEDAGPHSAELINRFTHIGAFTELRFAYSMEELQRDIDSQTALLALRIPQDFSRKLTLGQSTRIQAIGDGRRSNSGQIGLGYLQRIIREYGAEIQQANAVSRPSNLPSAATNALADDGIAIRTYTAASSALPSLEVTHWFNPNLQYLWFTLPGLVMLLSTLVTMIVTALSVARERELGTFDQLLVSPYSPAQILIGKTIPAFIIAAFEVCVIILIARLAYGLPFRGEPLVLVTTLATYILCLVGVGLFISSLCSTQQQAILGVFSFMLPAILLSGYASPIDNMPEWLQTVTLMNPLRYMFILLKGVFLKGMPWGIVWESILPMLVMAAFTLSAANWLFRHKLN